MDGFRLDAQDEFPHAPDAAVNFNESVYTNAFDFRIGIGGWMRLGNRANEGHAELSVCLYLPDGRIACQFQRPLISGNAQFSAGGLSFQAVEPFVSVDMAYEGELLVLDDPELLRDPKTMFARATRLPGRVAWRQTAMSPVHGGEPLSADQQTMYGRDFSRGHFNQHMRAEGSIRVGDQEWSLNGAGWRDHSWGPRYWQVIYWYRLFIASFEDGRGFMLLKIADPDGRSRRLGVLLVDGAYEEVTDLDVVTDWTPGQDPARVRLGIRTLARNVQVEGEIMTLAPLRNRRQDGDSVLVSRIAEGFTRFRWDGAQGWGMTEYIERIEDGRLVGFPL